MCNICGTVSKMQVQLTFLVFLFLMCSGLCSDADKVRDRMEEEMLSSLFTEVKQSRLSTPLWQLPVLNLCRMLERMRKPRQEDWNVEDIQAANGGGISSSLRQPLSRLYDLLTLCSLLQPRELQQTQEYFEVDENSDSPLKRKSPYILKRELHTKKARRPYILKRSPFY